MRARLLVFGLLLASMPAVAGAEDYKVIVNSANPTSSVTTGQLSGLFLKKTPWPHGQAVVPVDLSEDSPVRRSFTSAVHARPVAAIMAYWQQKVFSGRDVQPPEQASDAEVIAFVRANPAAVGYVSADAAVNGVKVLTVN